MSDDDELLFLECLYRFRTAEDLTITSKRLERYEQLLDDIHELVPDNVQVMINAARAQVRIASN